MADKEYRSGQRTSQRAPQRRVIYTGTNRFDFDKSRIPEGMTYAYKRVTCGGMEDTEHQVLCEMNGWTPVPGNRHPELTGSRGSELPIIRGGQMLMEQPTEWAEESRNLDNFTARHTLEEQVQRLGLAAKKSGAGRGIKRSMEVVPELVE